MHAATGETTPPRDVFLVIGQTYTSVRARLITQESSSVSLVGSLDNSGDGLTTIQWTYRNTPSLLIQDRSRIHHGAAMMEVHGLPPTRLTGSYWTDRDTRGEMSFSIRSSRLHSDFQQALADPTFAVQ